VECGMHSYRVLSGIDSVSGPCHLSFK